MMLLQVMVCCAGLTLPPTLPPVPEVVYDWTVSWTMPAFQTFRKEDGRGFGFRDATTARRFWLQKAQGHRHPGFADRQTVGIVLTAELDQVEGRLEGVLVVSQVMAWPGWGLGEAGEGGPGEDLEGTSSSERGKPTDIWLDRVLFGCGNPVARYARLYLQQLERTDYRLDGISFVF
jgi:hypothetical protein